MSSHSIKQHLMAQLVEARAKAARVQSHPIMGYQWEQRVKNLESEIQNASEISGPQKVILYFTGKPVDGTRGIEWNFANDILNPYQEMVKSEFSAEFHGQLGERGPRRSDTEAKLYLTDLPRGSVGLELSPAQANDLFTAEYLSKAFSRIGEVIQAAAIDDDSYSKAAQKITSRSLKRLRKFFETLAKGDVAMEIDRGESQITLNTDQIRQAWERVGSSITEHQPITVDGVFNGAMIDSWRFDFLPDAADAIFGEIAEDIKPEIVAEWNTLTTKKAKASLNKIVFTPKNGEAKIRYEMTSLSAN